jgi:trans-2,3-dihydro-3-hydroxyanthranilate isomerase
VEFLQVDVFADAPYQGNPLAVFPDPGALNAAQMQSIAREMNLSETTFVTETTQRGYDVRIFTPHSELPFAGHPTIGTAWALRHRGQWRGDSVVQRSDAGDTPVQAEGEELWFERRGSSEPDLGVEDPVTTRRIGAALGLEARDVGLEAREMGRSGQLMPAFADAGLRFPIVPLRDLGTLERVRIGAHALSDLTELGVYCFTALQAGRIRARGFFPSEGITEDPATGSAAAALGAYLVDRIGPIALEVFQGVEMGRPSRILLRAERERIRVGGGCRLVLTGRLEELP